MNRLSFDLPASKTQYDSYKYKIKDPVSYGRRKLYRYLVDGVAYDIRTTNEFKFLYSLHKIREAEWEEFKIDDNWVDSLTRYGLYTDIIDHLKGIIDFHGFRKITLPNDLDYGTQEDLSSGIELVVDWFSDPNFTPASNQVYLVIFHR